jgi:hypothetical protein
VRKRLEVVASRRRVTLPSTWEEGNSPTISDYVRCCCFILIVIALKSDLGMINNQRNNTAAMINDLRVHQAKHMTEMRSFRSGGDKQQNMKFMK